MPNKVINTRIKQKRDTEANWQSKNPILLKGEIIFIDTNDGELRSKIGNGTSTYNQLPFSDTPLRNLVEGIKELVGDSSVSEQISGAVDQINTSLNNKSNTNHTHPVDSALSSVSTNPVQNKVVFGAVQALIDGLGEEPVADQIENAVKDKADVGHNHSGQSISPQSIELGTGASGHGGFIDFHFNGSTEDSTSRIIETFSGCLALQSKIQLTPDTYGTSLPAAGTPGRIFFKKV